MLQRSPQVTIGHRKEHDGLTKNINRDIKGADKTHDAWASSKINNKRLRGVDEKATQVRFAVPRPRTNGGI